MKILLAAYYFPPFAGVSGLRSAKHYKYLPEFGITPRVLTVDPRHYGKLVTGSKTTHSADFIRLPFVKLPGFTLLVKLFFPLSLLWHAFRLREDISAVYISGSPYHPFLASCPLTRWLKLPTVLDFRDSWSTRSSFDGDEKQGYLERFRRWLFRKMEAVSISYASAVVFATDVLEEEYTHVYPDQAHKFSTIYNGVDVEDIEQAQAEVLTSRQSLILTGKIQLYTPEVLQSFFTVLAELDDLVFIYVGNEAADVDRVAAEHRLSERVIALPFQEQQRALNLIAGADLAMMTNGLKNGLGTKILDYIALEKPTICFVPEGSIVSKKFADTPGIVILEAPHEVDDIRHGMQQLLAVQESPKRDHIAGFTRRNASRTLGQLLANLHPLSDS